jgi:hypothetical protein
MNVASSPYPVSMASPAMDRIAPKLEGISTQSHLTTTPESSKVMPPVSTSIDAQAPAMRQANSSAETYQVIRDRGNDKGVAAKDGGPNATIMLSADRDWQRVGQNIDETV